MNKYLNVLALIGSMIVAPAAWAGERTITFAVDNMTWHRGPSHSLLVLAPIAMLVWALLRRRWTPVREAPRRWLCAILLALLTHPLLDAFTVYGTQLLWPLPLRPVMWSSLFIIDPLYTLPLLVGCVAAAWLGARSAARTWLQAGVLLRALYEVVRGGAGPTA